METDPEKGVRFFDKSAIKELIPHRKIALTLDYAEYDPEIENGLVAIMKLPTWGKGQYFEGHYPNNPIFPGHWQAECMCLAGALLCKILFPLEKGLPYLQGMDGVDFKRPIKPGNDIEIRVKFLKKEIVRGKTQFFISGEIYRQGKLASSIAEIRGTLV